MPTWDRERSGIEGLEQDVKAVYQWVENKLAAHSTWVLGELGRVTARMATYEQAANDAIAVMQSLSEQLKAALNDDDNAAVQAVADRLEAAAQSFATAVQTDAPSPGPDAGNVDTTVPADQPSVDTPADAPSTDTPAAPAGTDGNLDPNAPSA